MLSSSSNLPTIVGRLYHVIEDLTGIIEQLGNSIQEAPGSAQGADPISMNGRGERPIAGPDGECFDIFRMLSQEEALELSNMEAIRGSLINSWRFIEGRKKQLIDQARTRADQGRVGR